MKKEFYLASYPRSGNTFTRLLLEHHFDIDSRECTDSTPQQASRPTVAHLTKIQLNRIGVARKTHRQETHPLPALVIVRDGRDVVVSYAHFQVEIMKTKPDFKKALKALAVNQAWSHFYRYWVGGRVNREPYCLLRYEQLVKWQAEGTAARALQRTLSVIGYDFEIVNREPLPGFEHFHKDHPQFFRRGVAGGWKDEMPADVEELFWETNGETMKWLGYAR